MSAPPFLLLAAVYAFMTTFSQFRWYDDEGRLMISVQGFLEGNPLYDSVGSHYGPVYYFYEAFLHGVLGIPLTNDGTAALCVIHWLLIALILAWTARRASGSNVLGLFTFVAAVVHLECLANEPGHPQEVVLLLLAIAALVATRGFDRNLTFPLLGALGAAIVLTKINVGAFLGFALLLTLLCYSPETRTWRTLFCASLIASVLFPLLLMRQNLSETWARSYAWSTAASVLAVGVAAKGAGGRRVIGLGDWGRAALASAALFGLVLGLLLLTGSSLFATAEALVLEPSKMGGQFSVPLRASYAFWSPSLALLTAVALAFMKEQVDSRLLLISAAKAIYGVLGALVLASHTKAQLVYLVPWTWLLLMGMEKNPRIGPNGVLFRVVLCFMAVWQSLQAYPVAGSQIGVGTLFMVLVYALCLYDALNMIALLARTRPYWQYTGSPKTAGLWLQAGTIAAMLEFLFVQCQPVARWRQYESFEPLGLPGAHYRRVPPQQALCYRALTRMLRTNCDTFVAMPGLNSLYFWTGKSSPTYFNISGENVMPNDDHQALVVAALRKAKRPVIVIRQPSSPPGMRMQDPRVGPLPEYIHEECSVRGRLAEFQILMPKNSNGALQPPRAE